MSFYKNVVWTLGGTIGIQIIGIITNIILARLITPEVFGLVGMVSVFIGLMNIVQEAGISSVIIQKEKVSNNLYITTFYLNFILSGFLILFVFALTVWIPNISQNISMVKILHYSIIGIFGGSISITQRAILTREKRFKELAKIEMKTEILSGLGSIVLALMREPLLAVGFRLMFRPALQTCFTMYLKRINFFNSKPNFALTKDIVPFSSNVLGVRILNFIRNNVDYLLIGILLGSYKLGIYTMAFQWSTVARYYISQSVAKVVFPEISRFQNDIGKVREVYLNVLKKISFITFPITIGLAIIAPEFVNIVYGAKWNESIQVLQILMIAGMITSIGTLVGSVFSGLGKPQIEFYINIFSLASFIVLIYLGSNNGIIGISYAVLLNTIIFNLISTSRVMKLLEITLKSFLDSITPAIYSMFSMTLILTIYRYNISYSLNNCENFVIMILLGIITYSGASFVFNKSVVFWVLGKLNISIYRKKGGI
ncbi:lipopolysaccharide biosynthesis protein [Paenibacillus hexagrammi]|uniref:Lipopolysaccharide biosynthesis protein n=1 Tax=Paenibacillus hexagrammi TaxID=2908839 RepID=A0ABY3SN80_9BACL|nr:lipopolysaccharide biosynthesis protein [Paenibacillus sp. YPD9-1]UJF34585.1 lipopolysaccharide biosynthesis protein [Paenibacillus sp. YPD9-1]